MWFNLSFWLDIDLYNLNLSSEHDYITFSCNMDIASLIKLQWQYICNMLCRPDMYMIRNMHKVENDRPNTMTHEWILFFIFSLNLWPNVFSGKGSVILNVLFTFFNLFAFWFCTIPFYHTNCMLRQTSVLQDGMHKISQDFPSIPDT